MTSLFHADQLVHIPIEDASIVGDLVIPTGTKGIVIFAHGSGSSRLSPRNQFVAQTLNKAGLGTLLLDLLTKEEEAVDFYTGEYRFNIEFLAGRLKTATEWVADQAETKELNIGYFGASTGAAAALLAAEQPESKVKAIVSRGGRPDLVEEGAENVRAPTLLIVGGNDHPVIQMNEYAFQKLTCVKKMVIIPRATHLFEEEGKLEEVAKVSTEWFLEYLK